MNRRNIGTLLGLGFVLLTSAIAGLYAGIYLGKRTGNAIFAPLGLIFGLGAGFHRAWSTIKWMMKTKDEDSGG